MAWLRLDDGFAQHPKIVALTPRDRWTWLELLCYCARYRTDGRVPAGIAEVVRGASPAFLERALTLTLLDPVPGTSDEYQIHDFEEYNPTRIDDADEAVATYLADNPQASANEVWRALGGSRNGILAAVRRYRTGTPPVPSGTDQAVRIPVSRARSRPVPSPSTTTAAASHHQNGDPAAAASTLERLEQLSIDPARFGPSNGADRTQLVNAWLDLAEHEAHSNAAGFVIAGVRSGQLPSRRVRAQDQPGEVDQPGRRRRFVEGDGWRLPADELEFQLVEMGADEGELVGLLEQAADLRRAAA